MAEPVTAALAAAELLARRRGRESLLPFTTYTMPTYSVNWHHRLMAAKLDNWAAGRIKRLMLFTPPRHGKSELASRRLPALLFGQNPACHVISCSYSADLASRMNRDVQRIMDGPAYGRLFPDTRLGGANVRTHAGGWLRNNDIFEIVAHGGSYRSAGVGGGITGMGFTRGIIDDPIKNAEEAASPTIREKVWEWYTSAFWTRQAPAAGILLIMTRWHVDDLAGRLLKLQAEDPEADQWEVVNLEAVKTGRAATPGDPRQPTQSLWEDRYGRDFLRAARSTLGSRQFDALYQGNPTQEGGNHFQEAWFRPVWSWAAVHQEQDSYALKWPDGRRELHYLHQCPRFAVVDPAASEKQAADFTAIGVFARTPTNDLLVLDMVRERLGVDRIVPRLLEVCRAWRPEWVGMESTGFQVAVANAARRTPGMPAVRDLSHQGKGKLVRATPAIIKAEAGQILLPAEAVAWKKPFVDELIQFTGDGDAHDDQVDVLAYAVIGMGQGGAPTLVRGQEHDQYGRGRR